MKKGYILGAVVLSYLQAGFGGQIGDSYTYKGCDLSNRDDMLVAVPPGVLCATEDGPNFYVDAAYTLWTAREEGLSFAISNWYTAHIPEADSSPGQVFYPDWKLRSGFKVGAGWYACHDCWDVKFLYTWFRNKNNAMQAASFASTQGVGTWLSQGFTLDSAASRWNNWFQRVDGQLGRSFYVGHYLSFRPFLGVLGAFDEQWFDIDYVRTPNIARTWRNTQKFWGIGPYAGFNSSFVMFHSDQTEWSLFLDSGFSLPWSRFKTHQLWFDNNDLVIADYGNTFWTLSSMFELALGLRYQFFFNCWCRDRSFTLQAAWEEQIWFSHNQFKIILESDTLRGNYAMQGFTLTLGLSF